MAELNEVVAEAAEEVAESATQVARFSRTISKVNKQWLGIGLVAGGAAGSFVTYKLLDTKLRKKYEAFYNEVAEIEIASMREHYRAKEKVVEPKPSLKDLATEREYTEDELQAIEEAERIAEEEGYSDKDVNVVENRQNVFENPQPTEEEVGPEVWDYASEVRMRTEDCPYVIHSDEFDQNEKNYTQSQLSYFAEDDVLCDERDQVIEDQDSTVGLVNLDKFGHGSGDPNVVYVRNDIIKMEFEVTKSDSSYAETVHGFIQHSAFEKRHRGHPHFDDD